MAEPLWSPRDLEIRAGSRTFGVILLRGKGPMRVDLLELLARRPIFHPSDLTSLLRDPDQLVITVHGAPWWRGPFDPAAPEAVLRLMFFGLTGGVIQANHFDWSVGEALEDFDVRPISETGWAQPSDRAVFCSGPIPDPLAVFVRLNDFLGGQGAFRTPADFLNNAYNLTRFISMASSGGFKLGQGPECVCALLCEELARQGVPHNVVLTLADATPKLLVRFGLSQFLCIAAQAEFDD